MGDDPKAATTPDAAAIQDAVNAAIKNMSLKELASVNPGIQASVDKAIEARLSRERATRGEPAEAVRALTKENDDLRAHVDRLDADLAKAESWKKKHDALEKNFAKATEQIKALETEKATQAKRDAIRKAIDKRVLPEMLDDATELLMMQTEYGEGVIKFKSGDPLADDDKPSAALNEWLGKRQSIVAADAVPGTGAGPGKQATNNTTDAAEARKKVVELRESGKWRSMSLDERRKLVEAAK